MGNERTMHHTYLLSLKAMLWNTWGHIELQYYIYINRYSLWQPRVDMYIRIQLIDTITDIP